MKPASTFVAALAIACSCGALSCMTSRPLGPRAVQPVFVGYNQAVAHSSDEQLLLNVVRLRYRDNPLFLEVGNVVAQYSRSVSAGIGAEISIPGDDLVIPGLSGTLSESPVVTIAPLKGPEYARRLLEPVDAETVVGLSFAGWSLERLLICCVQELNGVQNAPSAAGPTPSIAPRHGEFQSVATALRELQLAGALRIAIDAKKQVYLEIDPAGRPEIERKLHELGRLLGVAPGTRLFTFGPPLVDKPEGYLTILPRSLYGVLFFLSQGVEVPAEHEELGLVTVTRDANGARFDWNQVLAGTFRVRSGSTAPVTASIKVHYRGAWFWIEDSDLESKSTFSLLAMLFALRAGEGQSAVPVFAIGK